MTVTEKVAFLKGLIEGSELKLEKKEAKIFELFIEILDDVANTVSELDEDVSALYDDVEDIGEAMEDIDEALYQIAAGEEMEDGDEDFLYEVQCENCGEKIELDEDAILSSDIVCPSCGEPIEFEFECECEDCAGEPEGKEKG